MTTAWDATVAHLPSVDCVADGLSRGEDPRHCASAFASLVRARHQTAAASTPAERVGPVDGVILVHYSRAPCRKEASLAMLRRAGLPWQAPQLQFAEYLDADDLTPSFLSRCVARALCTALELTQASCTANHIYAWHLAAHMNWRSTLIIEDDAALPALFGAPLGQRLVGLPPDWLILNFACSTQRPGTGSRPCSRGYVLSREGVLAFKRSAGVVDRGADWLVYELSAKVEQDYWTNATVVNTFTHHGGLPHVLEQSLAQGARLPRGTDLTHLCDHGHNDGHRSQRKLKDQRRELAEAGRVATRADPRWRERRNRQLR